MTTNVNSLTLKLMPTLVHTPQFIVDSKYKTMNHEPLTINRKPRGFTLIELLVVISIIGILAAFIVASFTSAQQKARDSKRKSDLDAVKKALVLASNDCTGGGYPVIGGFGGTEAKYVSLISLMQTLNYIKSTPQDPIQTGASAYNYDTSSGTTTADTCPDASGGRTTDSSTKFLLWATLENSNDPAADSASVGKSGIACGITSASAKRYYVCEQ